MWTQGVAAANFARVIIAEAKQKLGDVEAILVGRGGFNLIAHQVTAGQELKSVEGHDPIGAVLGHTRQCDVGYTQGPDEHEEMEDAGTNRPRFSGSTGRELHEAEQSSDLISRNISGLGWKKVQDAINGFFCRSCL